ncbi:MarR family winged helix-turn-helix transcriptional regulator [Oscillibacter sp.]|jgi:DNA-binding MarR family transcriptional regulator|uniref:MarR family winged helix-turn-helix transcriptional regulator n=1 Tax=Oscillibacter sp. TaxID=1945593 RepID=UPI00216C0DE7|nr:MarR family transcriptional regulator [Oscillibacter sp.]MCI9647837.1 MarR family transcriptional regulator [Oscillibacter sp.]
MRQEDPRRLGPTLGWAAQMAKCAMDARVSRYDVTPVQAHVLMYLHQHGGQAPQRELTEFLRAKPSTVNGVLDRMEEKGLVRRSVIGEDARRRLITLTDKGREQQSRFTESFLANEEAMVRGFSPAERETLLELLERIVENLKEELRT